MSIDIKIKDNFNDIRIHYGNIKNYKTYKLLPGITVLVGCNGYGKSTTVNEIKQYLTDSEIAFCSFDGTRMGAEYIKSYALAKGDFTVGATIMQSSEGEGLIISFGEYVKEIHRMASRCKSNNKPFILFCDAIDSGLSIDKVQVVKHFLFVVLDDLINNGVETYIVTTANTFEMCRSDTIDDKFKDYFRSMNPYKLQNIQFNDYYDYEKFIIESSKIIEKRYAESNSDDKGEPRQNSNCTHGRKFDQAKDMPEERGYEKNQ